MTSPRFIPGLELCGAYFSEAVKPILDGGWPDLRYDAALIGPGSEVLGFDDRESTDHHWGPRVMLFFGAEDHARYAGAIHETLAHRLPYTFRGYPTHNELNPLEAHKGILKLKLIDSGPINHRVDLFSVNSYFLNMLGIDVLADWSTIDWLLTPQQILRTLTAGCVYHAGLGVIAQIREKLAYFPRDVWLYMLAAAWARIAQEEAFMGRAAHVGDELGSRIVSARLCRDLVCLCFLIERQYTPYTKWLGTAFSRLAIGPVLAPILQQAISAPASIDREQALVTAYALVAGHFNRLGLCDPLSTESQPFFGRPYQVIYGERFANAVSTRISDPEVQRLPVNVGAIDQWADSTDVKANIRLCRHLRGIYTSAESGGV